MSKFNNLKKYEVSTDPVKFVFHNLQDTPYLMVVPATENNAQYYAEALKAVRKNNKLIAANAVSPSMLKEMRDKERPLYARYVVRGWGNVKDDTGTVVPFSHEECLNWLEAIPDWVFDELRSFCTNVTNFVSDPIEVEEIAKNS